MVGTVGLRVRAARSFGRIGLRTRLAHGDSNPNSGFDEPGNLVGRGSTTAPAPTSVRVTFANTETRAEGSCPGSTVGQKASGSGTWTLTLRAAGEYDVLAEYESGAHATGRLSVRDRTAQLTEDGPAPGGGTRRSVGTHTISATFDRATGTAQTTLIGANGSQCVLTWDLTTTFEKPLATP